MRNLRKRQVVAGFQNGEKHGTYWGIRSHIEDYGPPAGSLPRPPETTTKLAETKTRLKRMDSELQERLINGVAICDAASSGSIQKAPHPLASPSGLGRRVTDQPL